MKLYLHIGFGKTGTTAIQDFLCQYQKELLEKGIFYPQIGLRGTGHHNLTSMGNEQLTPSIQKLFNEIKYQISSKSPNITILSSEFFCFIHPHCIREISGQLSQFDVKIIFYIRHQLPLIESTYLQWQKTGDNYLKNINCFYLIHRESFNFIKRIQPWVDAFGKDSIQARLYNRKIIGNDIRTDILNLVGKGDSIKIQMTEKSNTSLIPEFSNLVTLFDSASENKLVRESFIDYLLLLSKKFKLNSDISLIDSQLQNTITKYYRESNQAFADNFLDKTQADLFLQEVKGL